MQKEKLKSILWGEIPEVTEEVVEYFRENPDELDLIVDKEEFHINFLAFFFVLGLTLTIGARVLKYFFEGEWGAFINDVVLDVASELGIAVFGGAITAYLLEYLKNKQYEQNIAFRNEVKSRLKG